MKRRGMEFFCDWWWDLRTCCKKGLHPNSSLSSFSSIKQLRSLHHSSRIFEHLWVWLGSLKSLWPRNDAQKTCSWLVGSLFSVWWTNPCYTLLPSMQKIPKIPFLSLRQYWWRNLNFGKLQMMPTLLRLYLEKLSDSHFHWVKCSVIYTIHLPNNGALASWKVPLPGGTLDVGWVFWGMEGVESRANSSPGKFCFFSFQRGL